MGDAAPLVHEDWEGYEADDTLLRKGNTLGYSTIVKGDADAAMATADVVVKGRYVADASQGAPIEPRALIAQWNGDRVTVWSSTQVPFAARSGVAHTLQIPESHVRIVVPLLGGGFGSKCDFHFEAHVAALARVARRPVKIVFSRHEEFVAPDHRREGMVIELETGVKRDGTIVARRGRLVLDKGAYCGEGGFFAQMAAMHACGPYKLADRRRPLVPELHEQPAVVLDPRPHGAAGLLGARAAHGRGGRGASTWIPVELRRRTLIAEGDEGPTGQIFEPIGMKETLEKAVELIGYGQELPEDEAIGVACGWWPSFGVPSGAYVKLNGDGTGTIITGAQESGTGAVMGLPLLAAEVLGMQPEDFSILYQDTDAGPWDMGSSGSQTTFNNGRAVIEAASEVREQLLDAAEKELEASRGDLELADGAVRVEGLAGQVGLDRRPRRLRHAVPRQGLGRRARGAGGRRVGVRRPARHGVVPRPAADHARRARQGRPRDRRRARAALRGGPRLGRDRQPDRRRRAGLRRRRHGHRPGAQRGHAVRRERPAAQPAPARLQARDGRGRARDHDPLGRDADRERRAQGLEGRRRAAGVSRPRAPSATRSRRSSAAHVKQLPMTPERVWSASRENGR